MNTAEYFNEYCDVLIAGAGPAGLLLGHNIAKYYKVIIIDKGKLGITSKFWMTTPRRLQRHNLIHCEIFRSDRVTAGSFMGSESEAVGEISIIDEHLLLATLISRCKESGVCFHEFAEITSFHWERNELIVYMEKSNIKCRLLIDCTGGFSNIASTLQLFKLKGFFSIYGSHLRNIELNSAGVALAHILRCGYPPPFFEVIPTGMRSAICALFIASGHLLDPKYLRELFLDHINNNPFFIFHKDSISDSEKIGGIPIGKIKRRYLSNIISYGEAALMQPPLTGTAFNEILEYNDCIANQIHLSLKNDLKGRANTKIKFPFIKSVRDNIQRIIFNRLISGNVETFDKIVKATKDIDPKILFRFYSNELEYSEILHFLPLLWK